MSDRMDVGVVCKRQLFQVAGMVQMGISADGGGV
jgi:hypothetical protein